MDETQTMVRTHVTVNSHEYSLAQGVDIGELKNRFEDAAREGPRFVSFVVVGNRMVDVLVTGGADIAISVETVQFDPRDTGDEEAPYGQFFDF